ncbi:glycine--tRNA ligase [Mucilaginibacter sp.]|uniref:glycine--tRNA ligase n=1 Tax=Mucilaginibacter sp. TaxID=1882438 RepID=UPI003B0019B8
MSKNNDELFKDVISHAKEYGFVFQSSEIYDGLSAVYDYGQYGSELKNNIKTYWWKAMVQLNENIVGIDSAIFMHPKIWEASGHVAGFNDPMIDNKDSKKRYRADQLIEDKIEKLLSKSFEKAEKYYKELHGTDINDDKFMLTDSNGLEKEFYPYRVFKAEFGFSFDKASSQINTPSWDWSETFKKEDVIDDLNIMKFNIILLNNVPEYVKAWNVFYKFQSALEENDLAKLKEIIEEEQIADPVSGTRNWTEVRQFNLMFSTQFGAMAEGSDQVYLRPETAQGIFVNFLNVQKSGRMKIPFGIAQIGKAFRNEVIARQFILRMREFEQMEMQFFIKPGTEMEWFEHWKAARLKWHLALGTSPEKYRFHDHTKLAHYANAATDIEFEFPFGFKEVEGIHSRTDFDLSQHEKFSGKKLRFFDPQETDKDKQSYVPYVIETSIGLDRMFLLTLINAYEEQDLSEGDKKDRRIVLKFPPALAPIKAAILPLTKKDGLPEKAREIMDKLKLDFNMQYDEKDSIGKRYRRQDAIGTPFCITIDHQTLEDDSVTIRHRDTMIQERVKAEDLEKIIGDLVSWKKVLA